MKDDASLCSGACCWTVSRRVHISVQVFLRSPEHAASGKGQVLVYAASWWSAEEVLMPPLSCAVKPVLKSHALCVCMYLSVHV